MGGTPPREIRCESNLEAKAAYVFLADRDIVDVLEQPPAVTYLDEDGERRQHTFDFLLTRRSGERILIAVKPAARARAQNLQAQLRQIAAYVPKATADAVKLITEANLGRDRVHDAKLCWVADRTPDPEADVAVAICTADLTGAITIEDLIARTGLAGRAFFATVRAIANGRLTADAPRINYETRVRMPLVILQPHDAPADATKGGSTMSAVPEPGMPPLLRHHTDDLHAIGEIEYRWYATTDSGYIFTRVQDPGIREAFTFDKFDQIRRRRDYRFERGWFEPGRVKTRLHHGVAYIADCSSYIQRVVLYRMTACTLVLQRIAAGTASLSDDVLEIVLPEIGEEIKVIENPLRRTKDGKLRKRRGGPIKTSGQTNEGPGDQASECGMVGAKAFREWLTRLRDADFDPRSLIPHYGNCGPRAPVVALEVRRLAIQFIIGYAASHRPKKKHQYEALGRAINDWNKQRLPAGLEPLLLPSSKWFNRQIAELDAFDVYAGRYTEKAAIAHFRISSGGLEVSRPLERVEMDEWEVSLSIIFVQAGFWDFLPVELREEIAKQKCHIAVAIDCYSRCILGMNLAWTASPDNALAALRMALSNKGTFADSLGTLTPWDMFGLIEQLVTDGGPSFSNRRFRRACLELGIVPVLTIGGLPWMRGRVERFFSRAHTELVSRFSGRTFQDVVRRGAYESEKNASLTIEDMRYVFVRYIADIYHNRPHEGLAGKTPREVWIEGIHLYGGLLQPPDRDRMRAAFGIERQATLDHEGVRFLALHYQSAWLQQYRRKVADGRGTTRVRMRIDPYDLGMASVQIEADGPWIAVSCTTPGMDDVTVHTWTLSLADIRARFGPSRMRSDVIQNTIHALEALGKTAEHRAGLAPATLTQEQLDYAEANLALGMQVPHVDPANSDQSAIRTEDLYRDAITTGAALGDTPVDESAPGETSQSDGRADADPSVTEDPTPSHDGKKWSID